MDIFGLNPPFAFACFIGYFRPYPQNIQLLQLYPSRKYVELSDERLAAKLSLPRSFPKQCWKTRTRDTPPL